MVTSPDALPQALANARPGTVIELAAGDYGSLNTKNLGGTVAAPVTLRSADPAHPARFATMELHGAHDLILEKLEFAYHFRPGDLLSNRPFQMAEGQNVMLRDNVFVGDVAQGLSAMDDGHPSGFGLSLRYMAEITLLDNDIHGFYRGLSVAESSDLVVQGTDIYGIRMDGMNFAQLTTARIEGNHIHDFARIVDSPDHSDMIQFWTASTTKPSTDITIRGNLLNSGKGWFTHSIFMRNERVDKGEAGPEMFYRNITIEDNVIINAHVHGISTGETDGLIIKNNTLVHNAASNGPRDLPKLWVPQIRLSANSVHVTVTNNVVTTITGYTKQDGWTVSDNFLIQDTSPGQPGYYDKVFVAARQGDPRDLANFAYRPGGPLSGKGIGAPQLDTPNPVLP